MRDTYSLALPVYVPTFLLSVASGILVPTLPLYAQSLLANRNEAASFSLISLAVAADGFGTLIGDVPSGMLLERYGRKPVMVVGTVSLALVTAALAILQVYPVLVALRLVSGIGTAMWNISRMAYLTDVVPIRDRGRALSAFGGINRIGTFVGPFMGGLIGSAFGLAAPFAISAVAAALAALISVLFVTEAHHRAAAGGRHGRHMRWSMVGMVVSGHWKELSTAGSAQIFGQMIRAGRRIVVPLYAKNALGLDVAAIGSIVSISSAVDMSLFIPAGIVMDKLGRKFVSVPSFVVMAIGMALIPLSTDYVGLLFATCVIGFGNGLGSGTMMTLGADLAPRQAMGEFLGVWRLIGDVGSTSGPLVVGGIADLVGLGPAAFGLAGMGLLAASTLLLFVRETLASHPGHGARAPAEATG